MPQRVRSPTRWWLREVMRAKERLRASQKSRRVQRRWISDLTCLRQLQWERKVQKYIYVHEVAKEDRATNPSHASGHRAALSCRRRNGVRARASACAVVPARRALICEQNVLLKHFRSLSPTTPALIPSPSPFPSAAQLSLPASQAYLVQHFLADGSDGQLTDDENGAAGWRRLFWRRVVRACEEGLALRRDESGLDLEDEVRHLSAQRCPSSRSGAGSRRETACDSHQVPARLTCATRPYPSHGVLGAHHRSQSLEPSSDVGGRQDHYRR